jgi:enoyl-CoA hydratase/carnithine racemase
MSDELLFEIRDRVAWLTLNRPQKRNSINPEIIDALAGFLDRIEADEDVRAVCLTGAGDKAFCAGADLATSLAGEAIRAGAARYAALLKRLAVFPRVIVARVNGSCVAGGLGLMLSADLVYARDDARFGAPEVNVGLFPMMVAALLFRTVGRLKGREMVFTGRMYSAAEAEAMGLITRAVPAGEFEAAVDQVLAAIAAKGPVALRMGRQALAAARDLDLASALDFLGDKLGELVETEDAREGLLAFMQKRDPVWKNR